MSGPGSWPSWRRRWTPSSASGGGAGGARRGGGRAQQGDRAALASLRQVLDRPKVVDVLGGDLAQQARLALIDKFSGQNLVFRETIPRKLDALRAELEGPDPSPLERLLVDRVV